MTRRIRAVGEAAVPEWVAREARKFQYPDFDTIAPAVGGGGGGGAPTIVIAASNSIDIEKAKADLVCTGVNDQDVIQEGLFQLAQGGRLLFCSGNFKISFNGSANCVTTSGFSGVTFEGVGTGATRFDVTDSFSGSEIDRFAFECTDSNILFYNLAIRGGDGVSGATNGIILGDHSTVREVILEMDGIGVRLAAGSGVVDAAQLIVDGVGIQAFGDDARVVNNEIDDITTDAIQVSGADRVVVANNVISIDPAASTSGVISTGSGSDVVVAGNSINGGGASTNAFISIGTNYTSVVGNTLEALATGPVLIVTAIDGTVIADNNLAHTGTAGDDTGIQVSTASYGSVVTGNRIEGALFGIVVDGDGTVVEGNKIDQPATEGIHIEGDNNLVVGNKVESDGTTAFGINIAAGNDNAVFANYLGDSSAYGTADSVDSGTNTQVTPAAGAIGGQFAF